MEYGKFSVWNGRKLPVWNVEKLSYIPYHECVLDRFLFIRVQAQPILSSPSSYSGFLHYFFVFKFGKSYTLFYFEFRLTKIRLLFDLIAFFVAMLFFYRLPGNKQMNAILICMAR